jgi:luciferase family oxidoreductase group 1
MTSQLTTTGSAQGAVGGRKQVTLSILDLAGVGVGSTVGDALASTTASAVRAEELGYHRFWVAEHHGMPAVASSAPAVLLAHLAAKTTSIRLGSGGVMLPNHAPMVVAEQFGTLAALHPGRIDLGLGRAPGSDQNTMRALRRDPMSADSFPQDVLELQGYLTGPTRIPGVEATPGKGTNVPLYILGSSLFGARLAAQLGLPYAFASHFAPAALQDAVAIYRREFKPSAQLDAPHVIAGANVIAADSASEAQAMFQATKRARVSLFFGGGREFTDDEADMVLDSPQGQHVAQMMRYSAVGTPDAVVDYLTDFGRHADADELIVAHQSTGTEARLRSVELLAEAAGLVQVGA